MTSATHKLESKVGGNDGASLSKDVPGNVANVSAGGGDGAYVPTYFVGNPKPAHPVLSQLERSLSDAKSFDHDLETILGPFLNKPSTEVVDRVIEALYGKNGNGIPYFVELLAPRLGLDPKKLDVATIDKLVGKYGITKETLKGLIAAREKFDAATISQITTQLAAQLFADFMQGASAQIGNLAYKNRNLAVELIVAMQEYLGGPNAGRNIKQQLSTALTPDRIQGVAGGVIENAYSAHKQATPYLYK